MLDPLEIPTQKAKTTGNSTLFFLGMVTPLEISHHFSPLEIPHAISLIPLEIPYPQRPMTEFIPKSLHCHIVLLTFWFQEICYLFEIAVNLIVLSVGLLPS